MEQAFHCACMAGYGLTETAPVATGARHKSTVTYANEEDRYRRQAMAGGRSRAARSGSSIRR